MEEAGRFGVSDWKDFKAGDRVMWCATECIIISLRFEADYDRTVLLSSYDENSILQWWADISEIKKIKYLDTPLWRKLEGEE